ncbi:hypothetical protein [Streptomyces mexicanus]|uniref:Uncharacterized protein n=1 Tax=Streptomyces mexicanus TaxID=178566 RepID=A0A7X1LU44_9ACTN|nr:hypothetical protein [Streptomyces mexicanus]MBC2869843.1 hypothetical protein [Streptomyces mexicanus]
MRKRTYRFTAQVSDGKHDDGEAVGTVKARSDAEARQAVADWVRENGARKKRTWTATHIELT